MYEIVKSALSLVFCLVFGSTLTQFWLRSSSAFAQFLAQFSTQVLVPFLAQFWFSFGSVLSQFFSYFLTQFSAQNLAQFMTQCSVLLQILGQFSAQILAEFFFFFFFFFLTAPIEAARS